MDQNQMGTASGDSGFVRNLSRLGGLPTFVLLGFPLTIFLSSGGMAQEPLPQSAQPIEEVVVTGSRITRRGFETPTPVTTLSTERIAAQAPVTVTEVLDNLPSNSNTNTSTTSGVTSRSGGIQSANLRNLGAQRTLVLVDGRRWIASDADGVTDLKQIPVSMIDRIEVVTGGASAAWGSDAIAGVVNIILKDRIDGVHITGHYGISGEGDNEETRLSLASGHSFADEKGQVNLGIDYFNNSGIGDQYTRDWGWREAGAPTNGAFQANGLAHHIIAENVYSSVTWPGGLIVSGPLRGTAFGGGGEPFQFEYGQVFGAFMIGGTGEGYSLGSNINIKVPTEGANVLIDSTYDLTGDLMGWLQASYSWTEIGGESLPIYDRGNLTINVDNPFIPESVHASMIDLGLQSIQVGRVNLDTPVTIKNRARTWRVAAGLDGSLFESDDWTWEFYAQYGETDYDARDTQNRIQSRWFEAIDAVIDPLSGDIVCRSSLSDPGNGCVPTDIFGLNSISDEARNYVMGHNHQFILNLQESVAAGLIQGQPFSTWSAPVSIALGASYRHTEAHADSDPISQQLNPNGTKGGYRYGNQQPMDGSYDVSEVFTEALVPLATDTGWANSLALNAAVRQSSYSTVGAVTTWKLGSTYDINDSVRLRVTRSRDIRAPNLSETFQEGSSNFETIFNPILNTSTLVRQVLRGNRNLEPEEADTWTSGVVYQPSWADALQMSLDYFSINIDGVIATLNPDLVAERCFAGIAEACQFVFLDSDNNITHMIATNQNLNELQTSGFDFELLYSFGLDALNPALGGDITLRTLATYVREFVTTDVTQSVDDAGSIQAFGEQGGQLPDLKVDMEIGYSSDRMRLGVRGSFVDDMVFNSRWHEGAGSVDTINDNTIPSVVYWDLNGRYSLIESGDGSMAMDLFFVVDNLFDKAPPIAPNIWPGGADGAPGVTSSVHDVIGRSFKVGFDLRF